MTDRISGREVGRRIVAAVQASMALAREESARENEALRAMLRDAPSLESIRKLIDREVEQRVIARAQVSPAEMMDVLRPLMSAEVAKIELSLERRSQEMLQRVIDQMPKAATIEDIRPHLDAEMARYALDYERRAGDLGRAAIDRAVSSLRQPQDGASIEDFDLSMNERDLTVTMRIGGEMVGRTIPLPLPYDGGVYKPGQAYQRGAIVTFSGSAFIAQRDAAATEKPEASSAWRLLVKRGRDGKDAE